MDAVLAGTTIYQRRQTLHKMTHGFGLNDAYSTTLDRIRQQGGSRVKLGMEALMWISNSEQQLKAGELSHALAVEVGTMDLNTDNLPSIRTLASCTLGLVTVDERSSTVRLVHFTLQEYLVAHPSLFVTPHSMMAEICLTYLNFQSVCELSPTIGTIPSTMPFLHYASCYWGFHASKEIGGNVECLALQLLQRDANHIWVDILLREEKVCFLSWEDRVYGRSPHLSEFTGLHGVTYMGIVQVAIAMLDMKKWDLNGRDSKGQTPLIWAAKHGKSDLAKLLLGQQDVDPTLPDKQGLTPLIHAARAGHHDVVKLLLGHRNANPDSPDKCGRTPLSYAAGSGHESGVKISLGWNPDSPRWAPAPQAAGNIYETTVKLLLQWESVNSDSPDQDGRTPLSYAAESGCEGVVKLLLEQGSVDSNSSDENGRTPLSHAADFGREGVVRLLLQRGDVDPKFPSRYGMTPLLYAVQSGNEDVVKLLLERVNIGPNSQNFMELLHATLFQNVSVLKLLLERLNVDTGSGGGQEVLACAAKAGCEDIVEQLLERGYLDPDWSDVGCRTQLSYAAEGGCEGLVELLLGREDVNPDLPDVNGRTPLSHAAESGREQIIEILLESRRVNPNTSDSNGNTPLYYAVLSNEDAVEMLLNRGNFDPNQLFWRGRTPLSLAVSEGRMDVAKMLLERGDVDPNLPDENGQTPLSLAAERGDERLVKLLLEHGDINPNLPDGNGLTPLLYATKSNYVGTMRLLSKSRPSNHETSGTSDVAHRTAVPVLSALEEMAFAPPSRQGDVIPDARQEITEIIASAHSNLPSSHQLEACLSSSILAPAPISDAPPTSTSLNPSRPLKRPRATQSLLGPSKRQHFPSL